MRRAGRKLMISVGLVVAVTFIFASAAHAGTTTRQDRQDCVLPRPWYCLDVQRRSRADALHMVMPGIRNGSFAAPWRRPRAVHGFSNPS